MRKEMYALSIAAVAGVVSAQSQEPPMASYEDTVKVILFGDPTKKESLVEAFVKNKQIVIIDTFKIILTDFDAKNCTATIVNETTTTEYEKSKTTMVVDFKGVTKWSIPRYSLVLNSNEHSPVFKSVRVEVSQGTSPPSPWRFLPETTCSKDCRLIIHAWPGKAEKAMNDLMTTLCPTADRVAP